ncbi:hypothetical protein [Cellulophaga sp. Z1A5H]|uniref:hypothetical protein n=2 Tax=unclassified Cellulophaga TaxID=2634405 RepID=UPI0013FD8686|nr:hypothetical protein [Cellulophaga sp. Z1A5H]
MKLLYKLIFLCLFIFSVGCGDLLKMDTHFVPIEAENLYEYDSLQSFEEIYDSTKIIAFLNRETVTELIKLENFDALASIRYKFRESLEGSLDRMTFGSIVIDGRLPGFSRIEVDDRYVPHTLTFVDMDFFYYIPWEKSRSYDIKLIAQDISNTMDDCTIFYVDENSIIYGERGEHHVLHITYLEAIKRLEVFHSVQKENPFRKLPEQDLFSNSLAKLRLAKNFHNTENAPKEIDWTNFENLISRHQRKLFATIRDLIPEFSMEFSEAIRFDFELKDYRLNALIVRDSTVKKVFKELNAVPVNTKINLKKDATHKTLKQSLRGLSIFHEIEIVHKTDQGFIINENDDRFYLVFIYENNGTPYLFHLSGLDNLREAHFYFQLLSNLEDLNYKGL